MYQLPINIIGNSHVNVFSKTSQYKQPSNFGGYPEQDLDPRFKTTNLGPYLMYSVGRGNHEVNRKLEEIAPQFPTNSRVIFVFGEPDCREHFFKQSRLQNKSLEEIAFNAINSYLNYLQKFTFEYAIYDFIPCRSMGHLTIEQVKVLNENSKMCSEMLKSECSKRNILIVSIFDDLILSDWYVKEEYYCDDMIHLNASAFTLVESKVKQIGWIE